MERYGTPVNCMCVRPRSSLVVPFWVRLVFFLVIFPDPAMKRGGVVN